jgi:hypothetical protein
VSEALETIDRERPADRREASHAGRILPEAVHQLQRCPRDQLTADCDGADGPQVRTDDRQPLEGPQRAVAEGGRRCREFLMRVPHGRRGSAEVAGHHGIPGFRQQGLRGSQVVPARQREEDGNGGPRHGQQEHGEQDPASRASPPSWWLRRRLASAGRRRRDRPHERPFPWSTPRADRADPVFGRNDGLAVRRTAGVRSPNLVTERGHCTAGPTRPVPSRRCA